MHPGQHEANLLFDGEFYAAENIAALGEILLDEDMDLISHHLLVLAALFSKDFHEWLVQAEARLLAARLNTCERILFQHAVESSGFLFELVALPEYVEKVRRTFLDWRSVATLPCVTPPASQLPPLASVPGLVDVFFFFFFRFPPLDGLFFRVC